VLGYPDATIWRWGCLRAFSRRPWVDAQRWGWAMSTWRCEHQADRTRESRVQRAGVYDLGVGCRYEFVAADHLPGWACFSGKRRGQGRKRMTAGPSQWPGTGIGSVRGIGWVTASVRGEPYGAQCAISQAPRQQTQGQPGNSPCSPPWTRVRAGYRRAPPGASGWVRVSWALLTASCAALSAGAGELGPARLAWPALIGSEQERLKAVNCGSRRISSAASHRIQQRCWNC